MIGSKINPSLFFTLRLRSKYFHQQQYLRSYLSLNTQTQYSEYSSIQIKNLDSIICIHVVSVFISIGPIPRLQNCIGTITF